VPINLQEKEILGITAYPSLTAAMHQLAIDVVIFVLPPERGETLLPEVKALCITKLWLQPGAESLGIIDYCAKNKITCIHHHCIMKEIMHNLQL
jgi:predicted CoA-binding protein